MKPFRFLAVSVAVIALGACSTGADKKFDYRGEQEARKPLEVPPDLVQPSQGGDALSPADVRERSTSYSDYAERRNHTGVSSSVNVLPKTDGVTLMRDGAQRWLVIEAEPEQVWPLVRAFFIKNGLTIEVERPEAGVIETAWAENYAKVQADLLQRYLSKVFPRLYSAGVQDRYRVRLDRGQKPGTTEIFLTHRQLVKSDSASVLSSEERRWEPAPSDPDLEAEMLRLLMVHMGAEQNRARELLADAKPVVKAQLRRHEGEQVLTLNEEYETAWRRIGLALDRAGAVIEDRNRSEGLYYLFYRGKREKKGFWAALAGKEDPAGYLQVRVVAASPNTEVRVLSAATEEGAQDQAELARQLLNSLFSALR